MSKRNLFDELSGATANEILTPTDSRIVPNVQPKITNTPYRIAIVGEAPGADEIEQGTPFVGYSGKMLNDYLSRFGILRDACLIANICQHRPPGNKIASFDWEGPEIQGGLVKLRQDLQMFKPNIVLLLGGSALHAFKECCTAPVKKRKSKDGIVFNFPNGIGEWRGSFFMSHSQGVIPGVKCIASYHPAACMRQYEWTPLLMLDIKRCLDDAATPELCLPQRELRVNLTYEETINELDKIIQGRLAVGTDIEGYWGMLKCISFAPRPDYAFILPFTNMDGSSVWELDQEVVLMRKMIDILCNKHIVKTWQNGLYDRFVFQHGFGLTVRGTSRDIMLLHWELYCELERRLAVQASIYTKEPFYKEERDADDRETFWKYCCRDSALTKEIELKLDKWLPPASKEHYKFNESLICALLYMQTRGLRFDKDTAKQRLDEVKLHLYNLQHDLDLAAGYGVKTNDKTVLMALVKDVMCYKRDTSKVKTDFGEAYNWAMRVLHGPAPLTKDEIGRLSTELKLQLNIEGGNFKPYLYETLALPIQKSKTTDMPTADYEALQTLWHRCKTNHSSVKKSDTAKALTILPLAIAIGELKTRSEHITFMLNALSDLGDNRLHTFYNEVGSETGRVTCGKLFKKYGYPMQTVEDENDLKPEGHPLRKGLRDLIIADEGHYLAKCDLKGADGWTIGAHLAALGCPEMLDDLKFGLKPANIACYAVRHGPQSIIGKSRPELLEMCLEVKKSDWDYFAFKQCVWGWCYLMGIDKSISHVFKVSEGTVLMSEQDMTLARNVIYRRYNVIQLHRAVEQRLFKQPYPPKLLSPSGHLRMFFARKSDIVGQALAHEPQSITTYATNMAVYKCWNDAENRTFDRTRSSQADAERARLNKLRIQPMHQVHDEFLAQFPIEDTTWAIGKIKSWFANPIKIAGVEVTIPFEGAYGTNWSMDKESKKGNI